jgi:hypothetical protein
MTRELRDRFNHDIKAVKAILRRWDPIGVFNDTEDAAPADEYDSYAPRILSLLYSGASAAEVAAHLNDVRTNSIGLPPHPNIDEGIAAELVRLPFAKRS